MRITILGGSGLIGRKLTSRLTAKGHAVVVASPSRGVDSTTGAGLADALSQAQIVIDVTNPPSFEDRAVMNFFETSTRNLLAAAAQAGVRHLVAVSIVGADDLPDSGYMRAKTVQENLIRAGGVPYTIVRSTQFLEFIAAIAESFAQDGRIVVPPALLQPIASDDVADAVTDFALGPPVNDIVEIAGPEALPIEECIRRVLAAKADPRPIVVDGAARYFGTPLDMDSLIPRNPARLGVLSLNEWIGAGAITA